jgi:outer membrane protein W
VIRGGVLGGVLLAAAGSIAHAQPADPDAPAAASADASVTVDVAPAGPTGEPPGWSRHRLYARFGAALVAPAASSHELQLANVDGAASLAVQDGPIAGSGASVGSAFVPAIILGYFLPHHGRRLALETVLGTPFTVQFHATGTLANQSIAPMALGIPTGVPALGPQMGEAKAAPPMLTVVYFPHDFAHGRVRPLVGLGAAVLLAYDGKVTNPILTEVGQPSFHISPAPGLVLQTGADIQLWHKVYARLDVKFIALMQANAEVEHIQVKTPNLPLFDTVEVGTAKMSVWVNPFVIQGAIGYDF